jgi:hypothetical protein
MTFPSIEDAFNYHPFFISENPIDLTDTLRTRDYIGIGDTSSYQEFNDNKEIQYRHYLVDRGITSESKIYNFDGFGSESNKQPTSSNQTLDAFGVPVSTTSSNNGGYESGNSPTINDWFSQNLLDQELIFQVRNLAADGQLSRNDMIAIFRNAQDGDIIDANEYKDLQTILNNASNSAIEDHVRVLSSKVVFGTTANKNYQGQALGNLYAGSSSDHMEKLINKWFLGIDRPNAPYTYKQVEGSLFQDGVSYRDISQGVVGNCYLLAALAKVAISSPSAIENMFIDNGDKTFTVRFFNNGVADYVTVDLFFPIDGWDEFIYANQAGAAWGKYNDKNNELWVALAEKAYAQLNEAGWIGQDNTNSYAGISGGWDTDALKHITGITASSSTEFNLNTIVNAYNNGTLMGIASKASGLTDSRLVPNHIYVVVDYNPNTQQFTLFNPWGIDGGWLGSEFKPGFLTLSIRDLQRDFTQWSYIG